MNIIVLSVCMAAVVLGSVATGYYFGLQSSGSGAQAAVAAMSYAPAIEVEMEPEPEEPKETLIKIAGSSDLISVPGFKQVTMIAGQDEQAVSLYNPEQNTCYFVISLILPNGSEVFRSGLLAPGKVLDSIELLRPLEDGVYPETLLRYSCYAADDMKPLNGADVNFMLEVK